MQQCSYHHVYSAIAYSFLYFILATQTVFAQEHAAFISEAHPIEREKPLTWSGKLLPNHNHLLKIEPFEANITAEIQYGEEHLLAHFPYRRMAPLFILIPPVHGEQVIQLKITSHALTSRASAKWSMTPTPLTEAFHRDKIHTLKIMTDWLTVPDDQKPDFADYGILIDYFENWHESDPEFASWAAVYAIYWLYANSEWRIASSLGLKFSETIRNIKTAPVKDIGVALFFTQFISGMALIEKDSSDCLSDIQQRQQQAELIFTRLINIANKNHWLYEEAYIRNNLGISYIYSGQHQIALLELEKSRVLFTSIDDVNSAALAKYNIGAAYNFVSEYLSAQNTFYEIINNNDNITDPWLFKDIYYELAITYLTQGKYSQAIKLLQDAIHYEQLASEADSIGRINYQIGRVYYAIGDYRRALRYVERGIENMEQTNNARGLYNAYNTHGNILRALGRHQEAIASHTSATKYSSDALVGESIINLAFDHTEAGEYEKAIAAIKPILTSNRSTEDNTSGIITRASLINDWLLTTQLGEKCIDHINENTLNNYLNMLNQPIGEDHLTYHRIAAEILFQCNNPKLGSSVLELALQYYALLQSEIHTDLIRPLFRSRHKKFLDFYFDKKILPQFNQNSNAGTATSNFVRFYNIRHLEFLTNERHQPIKKKPYHDVRTHFSNALLDQTPGSTDSFSTLLLADSQIQPSKTLTQPLASKYKGISTIEEATRSLLELNKNHTDKLSEKALREQAPADTSILFYRLGHKNSYLWKVENGHVAEFILPSKELINNATRLYKQELLSANPKKTKEYAHGLAQLILPAEICPLKKTLIISPDSGLKSITFDLLPDICNKNSYLIENRDLAVLLDFDTFNNFDKKLKPNSIQNLTLMGDPQHSTLLPSGVKNWPALPSSSSEIQTIKEIFSNRPTQLITGNNFTYENVFGLEHPENSSIHIATHGHIDLDEPERSYLLLTETSKITDSFNTNYWAPADIRQHNFLGASIAISACDTGYTTPDSDYRIGMVSDFLHAGASHVIAPLWQISDNKSLKFWQRFYKLVKDDETDMLKALSDIKRKHLAGGYSRSHYFSYTFFL